MTKLMLLILLLVSGMIQTWAKPVESHRNGAAPNDDMTMLVIRCRNL